MRPYRTLLRRGESEFIVNKSRFIGAGAPAESEEEARAFLQQVRALHPAASHHCFAYVVGPNMGIMRYSDDGEPDGTAGLPIIETIKSRGVTSLCVVVTRYFGGVLLGAGGLARAYARGAAQAIDACGVGEMLPTARYLLDIPYPLWSRVEHYLKSAPIAVDGKTFAQTVMLEMSVRVADEDGMLRALAELSDGALQPLRIDEVYRPWTAAD